MPEQLSEQESARPYIGGQAVIEGVMMRSPRSLTIVCRKQSGELVVRERAMPLTKKGPRSWPFVRGVATVVESLRLGSQALRWSAEIFEDDLRAQDAAEQAQAKEAKASGGVQTAVKTGQKLMSAMALSIAALATQGPDPLPSSSEAGSEGKKRSALSWLPIVFALALFVALPQAGAEGINKLFNLNLEVTSPGFQAITGASKLLIVVGYLLLIRQIGEVRRVFQYHGAEHKAISTYEAHEDLRVENARRKTTMHPRCGTTFLVMVALVSIVVFTVAGSFLPRIPGPRWVESIGFFFMKLPFLPLIAAITFEIQRLFARYCTTGPLRALLWPGFLVQKITTAEPDDQQLEVALGSLLAALGLEAEERAKATDQKVIPPDRVFPDYEKMLADPAYTA
jgi:uncharacterized protein YqhQ